MTGRELIVYILENGLEDEPIIKDGVFVGFMTRIGAAEKFDVGAATVQAWIKLNQLEVVKLDDIVMIPVDAKKPNTNETRELSEK